jgi:hypothetical protein
MTSVFYRFRVPIVSAALLAIVAIVGASRTAEALPPAGTDQLPAVVTVDAVSRLGTETVTLTGWIEVERAAPHMDGGFEVVDMEITRMELAGASSIGAITVAERPNSGQNFISAGEIREKVGGQDFPASTFFDVFANVTVPANPTPTLTLHNNIALRVTPLTNIGAWPPLGVTYHLEPIYQFDDDGDTIADEDSSDDDGDGAFDEDPDDGTNNDTDSQCEDAEDDDGDAVVNDGCPIDNSPASPETGAQCTPPNAADDDGDSVVNDGCPTSGPAETGGQCSNAIDDDGDTAVNDGCPSMNAEAGGQCANAIDNDADGSVNDGCPSVGTSDSNDEDPPFAQCILAICDNDGDGTSDEDPGCVPLFTDGNSSLPHGFCVRDMTMEIGPETPSFSAKKGGPSGLHGADILAMTPGVPPDPPSPPPPTAVSGNDNFPGWVVAAVPFIGQQSTVGFTTQAGEPNVPPCTGFTTSASAWYTLTAASTGSITVDTVGTPLIDTVLTIHTGNAVNALSPVGCDDDSGGGVTSRLTFQAVNGTTYRIRVATYGAAAGGNIVLNITPGGSGTAGADSPFVRIDCLNLGLTADGCDSSGNVDDLDALSYGFDLAPAGGPEMEFSVGAGALGANGTAVRVQSQCPAAEPEPDVFLSSLNAQNSLVLDGNGPVGACTSAFPIGFVESAMSRDNLDALEALDPISVDADLDGVPEDPVYFSLDPASPSLGANSAADILKTINGGAPTVFANAAALGLVAGDDVDAICLKESGDGSYSAGIDQILFSLAAGSPTLGEIGASPGDVLAPGAPNPSVAAQYGALGLLPTDDLDALTCSQLKDPDADTDGDTIPNGTDTDDDNDGCTDTQEAGDDQTLGGKRDPHNFWDLFDVPAGAGMTKDKAVSGLDIFAILGRFGTAGDPGGNPLSPPPPTGYHTAYDRGIIVGSNVWNLGAANGSIAGTDIFSALGQFGHSC